ncbi:cupredoxin domain-containing protein [Chitinimonas koreensis]|uniref:cupredoxin domain-containing protein n=1 Tax=Chitinimonas koreensis TaxID=356302 RepID=UPI000409A7CC|nr:cupredoxin domain-containing protein [Chitinimonas koreensis]QNM95136.1 cupredoxin domain-containing protein [Chitinimonas koreensis]
MPILRALLPALVAAAAAAAELPTYTVTAAGGRLSPARQVAPAGQRIKLVLINAGPGPVEFENLRLRVEKVLAPGARSFVVLNPLKPGDYAFIDEFHPGGGQYVLSLQ